MAGNRTYTAFLFPVVSGQLFLGQRNTPPFQGYWGPIGGKNDLREKVVPNPWDKPKLIEKMGGHLVVSRVDEFLDDQRREFIEGTAIREFCEEAFSGKNFPEDFQESDFTDITRVGSLEDQVIANEEMIDAVNYFYIAHLGRRDFSPNPRELSGFKPLISLGANDKIFPLGKLALVHMHYMIEFEVPESFGNKYGCLKLQIEPLLQEDFIADWEARYGDMGGPVTYYSERYFGRASSEPLVLEVLKRARRKS